MHLFWLLALSLLTNGATNENPTADRPPNFIMMFADDLGYGDLGCYGHPTIRTPNLDRMAAEGLRFTQFYSAAPVCTPSRAALMTGRLPIRNGMCDDKFRVLNPGSLGGIQPEEITIAETLKTRGYATACIGKWHLGHLPQYLPTKHGFDYYFGIPYSNDMKPSPLIRGEQIIEEPAVQETLTARYAEEAIQFIKAGKTKPFFLYLPFTFPHTPLHASDKFKNKSARGLYGDVVEELDWGIGQVMQTLRDLDLADKTLVFFSSDNGPWLIKKEDGGSAGLLREGKGSTWEGGMRVPGLAWWPGRIKPGMVSQAVASTMDIFPTFATLAGAQVPGDRVLDGQDISPLMFHPDDPPPSRTYIYYRGTQPTAIRKGPWKIHIMTQDGYGPGAVEPVIHNPPLLFNLDRDPSEKYDVTKEHPNVVADLLKELDQHKATVKPVKCQLADRIEKQKKDK